MLSISPFFFSILLELILLFAAGSIFLLIWVKKLKRRLAACSTDETPLTTAEDNTQADLQHYINTEIKLTQGRLETLFSSRDQMEVELTEPDWLELRTQYLELEKELSTDKTREDVFWKNYGDEIRRVLTACRLVKRLRLKEISGKTGAAEELEEEVEFNNILRQQADEMGKLVGKLGNTEEPPDFSQLKSELESVARRFREIYHCAFTMEDDNKFLRDQIQALLKA